MARTGAIWMGVAVLLLAAAVRGFAVAGALAVAGAGTLVWVAVLQRLLGDPFDAVMALLALTCAASFAGPDVPVRALVVGATVVAAVGAWPVWRAARADLPLADAVWWTAVLAATVVLAYPDPAGWRAIDPHPIYEASVGRCYERGSPLSAPDLSFAGKTVRYHWATTRLPWLAARVLGVDAMTGVFTIAPFCLVLLAAVVTSAFGARHPAVRAPAAFAFLLPFMAFLHGNETLLQRTLLMTISFWVGFLLMVVALEQLICQRHGRVVLAAALLLVSKASFFVTFAGGVVLLAAVERRRAYVVLAGALAAVFVVGFPAFLSGAHAHNAWILFPSYLWSFLAWNGGMAGAASICIALTLFWIAARTLWSDRTDAALAPLAAVGLSGLLGATLLTEVTEGNHLQFVVAAYFPLALLVARWLGRLRGEAPRTFAAAGCAVAVLTVASAVGLGERLAGHLRAHNGVAIARDVSEAYAWLADAPRGVVVFGNHHEWPVAEKWPAPANYVRSALSGQTFLCEDYTGKGVMLEPDLPARLAGSLHLHRVFTTRTAESERALAAVLAIAAGAPPGVPLSRSPRRSHRLAYTCSNGREWCALNLPQRIDAEVGAALRALEKRAPDAWLDEFLKKYSVRYVVLEAGDRPTAALAGRTDPVYRNGTVTVLAVRN